MGYAFDASNDFRAVNDDLFKYIESLMNGNSLPRLLHLLAIHRSFAILSVTADTYASIFRWRNLVYIFIVDLDSYFYLFVYGLAWIGINGYIFNVILLQVGADETSIVNHHFITCIGSVHNINTKYRLGGDIVGM